MPDSGHGKEEKEDRLAILQQLVGLLDIDERRALSNFLSQKNDPLRILPVEIVVQITSYLDVLDVWRYRLVNKQWHLTLSSDRVATPALNRWHSQSPSDGAGGRDASSATARARHIQALRFGSPFTARAIMVPRRTSFWDIASQADRSLALAAHRIAYVNDGDPDRPNVVVQDLISGYDYKLYTTAREAICSVALTASIVAFLNYQGKLYVSSVSNLHLPSREIRLPSSSFSAFAADGDVVAVVFERTFGASNYIVALYDHRSGASKEITLPCAAFQGAGKREYASPHVVLLNTQNQTIDFFTSGPHDFSKMRDIALEHRRHSFDGRELHASHYQRQRVIFTQDYPFLHCDLHPTGEKGVYIFRNVMMCSTNPDDHASSFGFALCFDAEKVAIEERYFTGEKFMALSGIRHEHEKINGIASDFTLWKGIDIRVFRTHVQFRREKEDMKASLTTDANRYAASANYTVTQPHLRLDNSRSVPNYNHTLFVNDTFVVAVSEDSRGGEVPGSHWINVFCFDEELRCHGFQNAGYWNDRDGRLVRVPAASRPEDEGKDRHTSAIRVSTIAACHALADEDLSREL